MNMYLFGLATGLILSIAVVLFVVIRRHKKTERVTSILPSSTAGDILKKHQEQQESRLRDEAEKRAMSDPETIAKVTSARLERFMEDEDEN